MKLYQIKAQALRLMFADSDTNFSIEDFKEENLINNPNTRQYLVGMDESIRRAIDLFYQFNGEISQMTVLSLDFDYTNSEGVLVIPVEGDDLTLLTKVYKNMISVDKLENLCMPSRLDVIPNIEEGIGSTPNVNFYYDNLAKQIIFTEYDMAYYEGNITFTCYYKLDKLNLPQDVDELEYDLNVLHIPEEVQRKIPFHVKGELYEEDEYTLAAIAKQEYIQFLMANKRRTFSRKNSRVKVKYPRGW